MKTDIFRFNAHRLRRMLAKEPVHPPAEGDSLALPDESELEFQGILDAPANGVSWSTAEHTLRETDGSTRTVQRQFSVSGEGKFICRACNRELATKGGLRRHWSTTCRTPLARTLTRDLLPQSLPDSVHLPSNAEVCFGHLFDQKVSAVWVDYYPDRPLAQPVHTQQVFDLLPDISDSLTWQPGSVVAYETPDHMPDIVMFCIEPPTYQEAPGDVDNAADALVHYRDHIVQAVELLAQAPESCDSVAIPQGFLCHAWEASAPTGGFSPWPHVLESLASFMRVDPEVIFLLVQPTATALSQVFQHELLAPQGIPLLEVALVDDAMENEEEDRRVYFMCPLCKAKFASKESAQQHLLESIREGYTCRGPPASELGEATVEDSEDGAAPDAATDGSQQTTLVNLEVEDSLADEQPQHNSGKVAQAKHGKRRRGKKKKKKRASTAPRRNRSSQRKSKRLRRSVDRSNPYAIVRRARTTALKRRKAARARKQSRGFKKSKRLSATLKTQIRCVRQLANLTRTLRARAALEMPDEDVMEKVWRVFDSYPDNVDKISKDIAFATGQDESPPLEVPDPDFIKWVPLRAVMGMDDDDEITDQPYVDSRPIDFDVTSTPLQRGVPGMNPDIETRLGEFMRRTQNGMQFFGMSLQNESDWTPGNIKDVMNSKHKEYWLKAMRDELMNLQSRGTFRYINKVPRGKKPLRCRWVWKIKFSSVDGSSVEKFKARIVAQGFSQVPHVNFDPDRISNKVGRGSSINTVYATAAKFNMKLKSADISGAYLLADLPEPIYVVPPPGIEFIN